MELRELLNEEQYSAVTTIDGPLLILAGAGSGKTRTITYRIAHMVKNLGINSYQILAITFTNKAAKEMKDRVRSLIGEISDNMWISTFHSLCVRILRREIDKLGYTSSFTIYDFSDQKTLVKQCMDILKINQDNIEPSEVLRRISNYKNQFIKPIEAISNTDNYREKLIAQIYEIYEKKLFENNSLDFDNLIFKTIELFERFPEILSFYQSKFKYIMVDEYQDTNYAQYYLVKMLADMNKNICVVGDDDQCIYQWRGADINNILDFEKDYKNTKIIKLEKNYRSKSNILDAANKVILNNIKRKKKILKATNNEGEKIKLFKASSAEEEALFVINEIFRIINSRGYEYRDFGILYRTNSQSRMFEEICVKNQIPYKLVGVMRFYERKEIKDVIAYIKTIVNPSDEISLRRIINEPKRGIGDTTLSKLLEYAERNGISLFDSMVACADIETISLRTQDIQEFINASVNFEQLNIGSNIEDFLENISLVSETDKYDEKSSSITLMTIHSSKGLEFPVVFMVGMENGIFPSNKCFDEIDEMEESRRLCYVGITRAKDILYFTYANMRMVYGETGFRTKSKFLGEVPSDLMLNINFKGEEITLSQSMPSRSFGKFSYNPLDNDISKKCNDVSKDDVKIGMKIKHKNFGLGMVVKVEDDPESPKVIVAFDNNGIKKLALNNAPIEFV